MDFSNGMPKRVMSIDKSCGPRKKGERKHFLPDPYELIDRDASPLFRDLPL